jgi:hypothetical protein
MMPYDCLRCGVTFAALPNGLCEDCNYAEQSCKDFYDEQHPDPEPEPPDEITTREVE